MNVLPPPVLFSHRPLRAFARLGLLAAAFGALGLSAAPVPVQVWLSTADQSARLARQPDAAFDSAPAAGTAVTVDPSTTYQTMAGFGASLTDSSGWLLTHRLSAAKRAEVMAALFGPTGLRLSLLRQVIGTSDFTTEMYSYADTADATLAPFSIAKDERYLIPLLKDARALNPELTLLASPWSPPGWMKTSGSMIGGTLKPEYYGVYASYFVKFLQAYAAHGLPIFAITPQNEPGYSPPNYPGMIMTPAVQTTFIKDHLGPALRTAGLTTQILCFDHNYDTLSTPLAILADPAANAFVAGTAFHHYGGEPSDMTALREAFPAKDIWFTEGGNGDWNNTFDNLAHELIVIPRHWAKSIIYWNIALDQEDGPSLIGRNNTNEGLLLIRSDTTDSVSYNPQYHYLGHLSKFVRPGAVRIASPYTEGSLETVAFRHPDGAFALVACNRRATAQSVSVTWGALAFAYTLPARSLVTFAWTEPRPPAIVTPPAPVVTAPVGTPVTLSVSATGGPLTYQWRRGGAALAGATAATLTLDAPAAADSGFYDCIVTNATGSTSSDRAFVTIYPPPTGPSHLVNIATRAQCTTGLGVTIGGFVLEGTAPRTVLVRALGPGLAAVGFSAADVLPDPVVQLYRGAQVIAVNDDWGTNANAAAFAATESAVGASPALQGGSKDAALLLTLPTGVYTFVVEGKAGASGAIIAEVYSAP